MARLWSTLYRWWITPMPGGDMTPWIAKRYIVTHKGRAEEMSAVKAAELMGISVRDLEIQLARYEEAEHNGYRINVGYWP